MIDKPKKPIILLNNFFSTLISVITKLFVLSSGIVILYFVNNYVSRALFINHLLEPAENENMFLIYLLKNTSKLVLPNMTELIRYGAMTIYPGLYHQLASLIPANPLLSGRLLSMISAALLFLVLALYFYHKTKDLVISSVLPLAVLGASPDFSYIFLVRTDALYLFTGVTALICFSLFNEKQKFYFFILGILSLLCSFLTKQTGIIFVPCCFLMVFYANRMIQWKNILYFIFLFGAGFAIYYMLFDNDFIERYRVGLFLYGSAFSREHFMIQYGYYKTNYIHFIYALMITLVLMVSNYVEDLLRILLESRNFKPKLIIQCLLKNIFRDFADSSLIVLILLVVATVKMCGNGAAFMNNYFLINAAILWYIAGKMSLISKKFRWVPAMWFAYGALVVLVRPVSMFNIMDHTSRLEMSPSSSVISSYIQKNRGEYLSSRSDDYIVLGGSTPVIEGSVFLGVSYPNALEKFPVIEKEMDLLKKSVSEKLASSEIKGVLLGIQKKDMMKVFPEIALNYKEIAVEKVKVGIFDLDMSLFVPKNISVQRGSH